MQDPGYIIVGSWNKKRGSARLNGKLWRDSVLSKNAASRSTANVRLRSNVLTRLRLYEDKWAALRGNDIGLRQLKLL